MSDEPDLPIEHFIQALQSQLDRAQETLAVKARAGLPLTFAVKDMSIELRAYVGMRGNVVRIRPAGPGEREASTISLALTTITKPMIEENTANLEVQRDDPSLQDVLGDEITEDERRRLEWAGIRSVTQLRDLERDAGEDVIQRVAQLPVDRLRMALSRAARPMVRDVVSDVRDDAPVLRIRGLNLGRDARPEVRIAGEPANVLHASDRELVVRPLSADHGGDIEVLTPGGTVTARYEGAAA